MDGRRASRDEWQKRVERWQESGLTAKEFASETGIRDLLCLLPRWPAHRVLEFAPAYWRETLQKPEAQQTLDVHVLRRVVLGLPGAASHRPPELPRQVAAVCDG